MGSVLSTVASTIEAVMDWIVEGVKRVGRAIWRAMQDLFGSIRDGFYWLRDGFGWIFGSQSTVNSTPVPNGPSPVPTPTRRMANVSTQQKKEMGQQAKQAKELCIEFVDVLGDFEEAMEASCANEETNQETERRLQAIEQKAHARNLAGRMAALMETAPALG